MHEYFITSTSFAAPFFSDTENKMVKANSPKEAMEKYVKGYSHPCGLYAAALYHDANTYHKGGKCILQWICNRELAKEKAAKGKGAYTYLGISPDEFQIDGKTYYVDNPKDGQIIMEES